MKSRRREFLKQSSMLGSSLLLIGQSGLHADQKPRTADVPRDDENATLKTLHSLRTIHGNFVDRPLPEPVLQSILKSCVRAANASGNQSYAIIVVKDRKKMQQVCGYAGSCVLVFCADYNRLKASAEAMGYHYDPSSIENFLTAAMNTALAAQTAVIAAKSLGVDSLLTNGVHRGDMERHWKLLDLPAKHCFPIIALVLGYPTAEPAYRKGRLTGLGIVHEETYHHLSHPEIEEITRKYDDKQHHLGLRDDWDANGYKHYLDWFFKDWARSADGKESQMLRMLKRCGFVETPTSQA